MLRLQELELSEVPLKDVGFHYAAKFRDDNREDGPLLFLYVIAERVHRSRRLNVVLLTAAYEFVRRPADDPLISINEG